MQAGQNIQNRPDMQPGHPIGTARRQWGGFFLVIGGTGLFLVWLSVGLAPSTWWLLFQVFRQFNALWAQQGVSVLGLLLLLIVQLLLSLSAWILLIRVAAREGTRLYARQRISVSIDSNVTINQSSHPEQPPLPGVQVTLMSAPSDTSKGGSPPAQSSLTGPGTITPPAVHKTPAASSEQTVQTPPVASATEVPLQHHTPLSSDAPEFLFQEKQMLPSTRHRAQQRHGNGENWSDPFIVHEDMVTMFLQENPPVKIGAQEEKKQLAGEPMQEFVFGNPFEGILPDVFEHDDDLKRSIREQHTKVNLHSISSNEAIVDAINKLSAFEHLP